ncbi:MAG: 3-phosphoshikimate 1-carboxyvinyltransferase [Deltaproteobacteria bacterium]|nr:MAG: 3-phosphoshikimate 1-carboxyvinyltransferase [Deltaproteobacteria bacterium]
MKTIETRPIRESRVTVPGSKSYTHRTLIAAALSEGICRVSNPLRSEDTRFTLDGLKQMGCPVTDTGSDILLTGTGGRLSPVDSPLYLGNSGTSMRLLAGIAALGDTTYQLEGTPRMAERPIQELLDALCQIGVAAASVSGNGCPPIRINGRARTGGQVEIRCGISSQYLSALMLIAPLIPGGLDIRVTEGPISRPYIDMTVDIQARFGISLERDRYSRFVIPGAQVYRSGDYTVEIDASNAGYFWAAGAVTGKAVTVSGITSASRQGDVGFARVLERMGCLRTEHTDGITIKGGRLTGIDVDMGDMPDSVPTLAVVAAHADGQTRIRNVAHLRAKESDRLAVMAAELTKMGAAIRVTDDGLVIDGSPLNGAVIETCDDHRIAMSFAVAGLTTPGVRIVDEGCVAKSFPTFWEVFEGLYA